MKLFKVYFIDPSKYPIFVVAKSFDDAKNSWPECLKIHKGNINEKR